MKTKENLNKGITLIALIITIVILLILAGVAIASLTNNGLLERANEAKIDNEKETAREKLKLVLLQAQIEKSINTQYNSENYLTEFLKKEGFAVNEDVITVNNIEFVINREKLEILDNENTEIDSIKKWLSIAALDNEYKYTTMQEILNDEICLEKLMNNNKAINYMVKNTKEIMDGICNSKIGIEYITKSEYAKYMVIKNETWCEKILQSEYEPLFCSQLSTVGKIETINAIENEGLYSTNQSNIQLYSNGSNGDPSYEGNVQKYLPLMFDQDTNTCWISRTTATEIYPARIGIYLESQQFIIYKIVLEIENGDKLSDGIKVQSSSNLANWNDISDTIKVTNGEYIINDLNRVENNSCVVYMPMIANSTQNVRIYSLQFYYTEKPKTLLVSKDFVEWISKINKTINEDDVIDLDNYINDLINSQEAVDYMLQSEEIINTIINNREYMEILAKNKYAKYKAITNPIFYNKLMDSGMIEVIDKNSVTVPTITSVTTTDNPNIFSTNITKIKIYSKGEDGDPASNGKPLEYLYKLFDNKLTTSWLTRSTYTKSFPARVGVMFDEKLICYKIEVNNENISKLPNGFCVQASTDLQNWEDLTDYITENGKSVLKVKSFNEYENFVCYIPKIKSDNNNFKIKEFKIYCIEKAE